MKIELITPEQLSHLKGLDSKKKQRKFLLNCLVENLIFKTGKLKPIFFKDGKYATSDPEEIKFLNSFLKSETFKNDHETYQKVNNQQEEKLYKYEFATYKKLSKEDIDEVCKLFSKFKSDESAQLNQAESNELINSSDKINEILVVDFENVSKEENPQ